MYDFGTGLDRDSFRATATFPVAGIASGKNLASRFKPKPGGVWELLLIKPLSGLPKARLTVSVKDRQGNTTRIERTFSVGDPQSAR